MNAIIYCRVSTRDQVEGTSLESQETACREHAKRHDLNVVRVFIEEGESAKFADRTQLLDLLRFCRDKKNQVDTLIVWKVDRFARNVEDHYAIKAKLHQVGVKIMSVTEPIDANPNGRLLETILAGFAQFDNDVRALRTIQGMQQRLREGIWPWKPPLGYLPPKMDKKTQPDMPDPRSFEPLKQAWKLIAAGGHSKAAIVRFLHERGVHASRGRLIGPQTIDHIFQNRFYAGVLRNPWTGEEHVGRHVPMITLAEFARVQEVVADRTNSAPHARLNEDFSLRGFVRCPSCEWPMTAAFSQGRQKRYAYYTCAQRTCPTRRRSYRGAIVHDEFEGRLTGLSTPASDVKLTAEWLMSEAREAAKGNTTVAARKRAEMVRINQELRELIAMRTARLISDDEFVSQREGLRGELQALQVSDFKDAVQILSTAEANELANSLPNLNRLWQTMPVSARHALRECIFPSGYVFRKIRTAETGLLFKTFGMSEDTTSNVAALTKLSTNRLIPILAEIRKFLSIVRSGRHAGQKAA